MSFSLSLATALAIAATTAAGPAVPGPGDLDGDLPPKPKVHVAAEAVCDPTRGISYEITTQHAPDTMTGLEMQWMDKNGATSQSIGQSSTVPSGEGTFDVRALMHTTTTFYASEWQEVVVDCTTDDGPRRVNPDAPRRVNPTFTG